MNTTTGPSVNLTQEFLICPECKASFQKPIKSTIRRKYCSRRCKSMRHVRAETAKLRANPELRKKKREQSKACWNKRRQNGKNAAYKKKYFQRPEARIAKSHRNRIQELIKKGAAVKSRSSLRLFGCSITFLMDHLQRQFRRGMSWNNYGSAWVVDHIIPCASFDLKSESEQVKCFHFSNLQPLFRQENSIKSSTIIPTQPQFTLPA